MAKIQIALCILLVACVHDSDSSLLSGLTSSITSAVSSSTATNVASSLLSDVTSTASSLASGSGIGSVLSGITSTVSSITSSTSSDPILSLITGTSTSVIGTFATQMKAQLATIETGVKSALTMISSAETVMNATIISMIGEFATVVDSLPNTDVDVSSCTDLASEIEEIAASALIETTTCSNNYVDTVKSKLDVLITVISNFVDDLYNLSKQISSISSNFFTFISGISSLNSKIAAATTDFNSVMTNVTDFMSTMANTGTTLSACGFDAAVEEVKSNIATYTIEITECVAKLTLSGSGLSSAVDVASSVADTAVSTLTG